MVRNVGIILAGGSGTRFKGKLPKQYCVVNGKELIGYSIDAFKNSKLIDEIVVVVDKNEFEKKYIQNKYNVLTVIGGKTRNESFKHALDYIKSNFPECEKIVENNAACPLITDTIIDLFLKKLDTFDYAQCTYPIVDALGCHDGSFPNRENYFLIQSPDAYKFDLIYKFFDCNCDNGHPAAQLPTECKGFNFSDFQPNIKVTYPGDIFQVKMILDKRN